MALATLSIDLVAKLASFERDMGRAARASEKTAGQIAGAFGLIKSAAGGLAAGIGVGGLIALTRSTIDSLDALNDLKDATGASIENISALEDVAIRTGTSLDTVGASLVKFNAALKDGKPGSAAAAAFDAIGLSVQELKALDPAEALRQTAVALAGFADDGNKARLAQELFGKSLREVAPFLADLSKQSQLNATVTAEQAEAAEKFNLQLFAMQKNLQDVSRSLVGPILTGMNGLIDKFRDGSKAGEGFIVTLLRQTEIARLLGLAEARNTGGASGSFDSAANERARARLLRQGKLSVDFDGPRSPTRAAPSRRVAEIGQEISALDRYTSALREQLAGEKQLTEVQRARLRISEAGAQGFSEARRAEVLALAEQIDKQSELLALQVMEREVQEDRMRLGRAASIAEGQAMEAANEARAEQLRSLDEQIDRLSGRAGDDQKRALTARLEQQLGGGAAFSPEELDRIVRGIGGVNAEIAQGKTLAEDLGLSFTSAFEDAIVGGKKFSDVLKGLEQDILRIVTRKLVTEPLGNAITGAIGGSGGGIAKFFGSLFSADGGGYTGSGGRSGGVDGRGGFLSILHPQETVIDHTRGQGGGGKVVNITVNQAFGASSSRATVLQAAADARRQLELGSRNM